MNDITETPNFENFLDPKKQGSIVCSLILLAFYFLFTLVTGEWSHTRIGQMLFVELRSFYETWAGIFRQIRFRIRQTLRGPIAYVRRFWNGQYEPDNGSTFWMRNNLVFPCDFPHDDLRDILTEYRRRYNVENADNMRTTIQSYDRMTFSELDELSDEESEDAFLAWEEDFYGVADFQNYARLEDVTQENAHEFRGMLLSTDHQIMTQWRTYVDVPLEDVDEFLREEAMNADITVESSDQYFGGSWFVQNEACKFIDKKLNDLGEDYLAKLVEDMIDCVKIALSDDTRPRLENIYDAFRIFFRLRTGKSSYYQVVNVVLPYINDILSESMEVQSADKIQDMLDNARTALNTCANVGSSPILTKIYKCAMYALSFSLFENVGLTFDKLGYSKLEQVVMKKKFYKKTDFVHSIFDTLLFICERGYQVYLTKDLHTIFHSGTTYTKIYDATNILKRNALLLTNPEAHGFTESSFRADLDNVIEKLQSVSKYSTSLSANDKRSVKMLLNDMQMLRDDVNTKAAARRNRKAPFSVLLFGDSGIGKTTLTEILCVFFALLEGLDTGSEFRYTRNPAAKHWDNYYSSVHTVVLEDVANENPNLGDASSVNEIIQIINNAAFCPDQAALGDKGRTPMLAKFVIGTTNVKDLNAFSYFSCPSAVQRRFPYIITPTVKPEYKDRRGMLNSSKVDKDEPYPDLWTFKVELVRPVPLSSGKSCAKMETLHEGINLRELLCWFKGAVEAFNTDQQRVRTCVDMMKAVPLCECCRLPKTMCEKPAIEAQDYSMDEVFYGCFILWVFYVLMKVWRRIRQSAVYRLAVYQMSVVCMYFSFVFVWHFSMLEWRAHRREFYTRVYDATHWRQMGERVQSQFGNPKIFMTLAATVAGGYMLYNALKRVGVQSVDFKKKTEVGEVPKSELNGRENVWYNDSIDLSPADFTRASASSKSLDFNQFCKMIAKNCVTLTVDNPAKPGLVRTNRALCLGGHIYVTSNHTIPAIPESTLMYYTEGPKKEGITANMTITLTEADLYRCPERDTVFIFIRNLPPKKNLMQYLMAGDGKGVFHGKYISREENGSIAYRDVKNISYVGVRPVVDKKVQLDAQIPTWRGVVTELTSDGYCGAPVVVESSYGYSILGMHYAKLELKPTNVLMCSLEGSFVNEVYEKFGMFGIQSGDFRMVSAPSKERPVTDLHKKSTLRYMTEGNAYVYGSFTDFRGKHKSSVEVTPMSHYLDKHDYKIRMFKPEMTSWIPWHIGARDLVRPVCRIETPYLQISKGDYVDAVLCRMKNINILEDQLIILDDFTAINGATVPYIDKVNRSTSAGLPWKRGKKYFMEACEPMHGMPNPVAVHDEIMDRVAEIIDVYKTGQCVHPNFCAHLKDEPVSWKKAQCGKTRIFTGAPFDWCIVVRKYLLSFCRVLQNERLAFESCPGTIAQSLEWQELHDFLSGYGTERIVAGDYKAFDKKMSPVEVLAAFDVIIFFCSHSGNYTKEDITVLRCIAEDTAFALVDYNGDLIQLFGSNPSGNPLTVVLNCIVNCLRMRYVYYKMKPSPVITKFHDAVRLATYGDDLVASVKKGYEWYNHTTIAEEFAKLDIVFTMADKEAESIPYIPLKNATFLKRTWTKHEYLGCLVAPLEHESIEKMLMVWTRSKQVTKEKQGMDIIKTALREYFWYGETVFEEKMNLFKGLVDSLGWNDFIEESTFPTFGALCDDFVKASRHVECFDTYFDRKYKVVNTGPIVVNKEENADFHNLLQAMTPSFDGVTIEATDTMMTMNEKTRYPNDQCTNACKKETVRSVPNAKESRKNRKPGKKKRKMLVIPDSIARQYQDDLEVLFETLRDLRQDMNSYCGYCYHSDDEPITIQSMDVVGDTERSGAQTGTQVTTTFEDTIDEETVDLSVVPTLYRPTSSVRSDIAQFLSRPVKITTINWAIGASLDTAFNPFSAFFYTTAMTAKLDHYAFIRCDLHVKFTINASPFYYGAVLMSYSPLENFLGSAKVDTSLADPIVPYSQRPHVWVFPQTNEGAEMVLPFLYPYEWLNVTSLTDLQNMGRMFVDSSTILRSANGTTGTSLDISVYAWAENVELAGLTTDIAVQSQDEYSKFKGPVSKPASALARASGMLSGMPVIGPYMTATAIGAGAVANIAALFGYSKVPVIDNVQAFKNLPFHGLASSDISDVTERLGLDSKNELTINNACLGGYSGDPLEISRICQHSSYLTKFTWDATDTSGTILWNTYVTPYMSIKATGTQVTHVNAVPMWIAANCFSYWRGDIILDFTVVCSQYHRGRFVVAWDPIGDVANTTEVSHLVYNQIIDISETTNFSVQVPYTQQKAYLLTSTPILGAIFSTSAISPDTTGAMNGILTVRVLNEQTSPVAAAPIEVMVTVRGAPNLEFAAPKAIDDQIRFYTVQSQDTLANVTTVDLGGKSSVDPHINLVYMGEKIESFRSLLMRANYVLTLAPISIINSVESNFSRMSRRPLFKGYDPNGIHEATGLVSAAAEPYNFVPNTPYHLLSPCFLGERGSFTWKMDVMGNDSVSIFVTRNPSAVTAANYIFTSFTLTGKNASELASAEENYFRTQSGALLLNTKTNTGVSVNVPMYNNVSFLDTSPAHRTLGLANISSTDTITTQVTTTGTVTLQEPVTRYLFQVGHDYSPFFFMNVPTLYVYDSNPVPVPDA